MKKRGSSSEAYKRLLEKVRSIDMGSRTFWSPREGRSVVRILPPVGDMQFFFKEVGRHYIGGKSYVCPLISTDGQNDCPACEVNEELYQAGEKEAAAKFRAQRKFYMNVIVRGEESAGPRVFTPGITIFGAIVALISDPDYGDITDIDGGTDVVINRKGTGLETEYQVMARRNASVLGTDEQVEEWLKSAEDLEAFVMGKLLSYEDMANATGAAAYLDMGREEEEFEDEEEFEEEEAFEEEEEPASSIIRKRLAKRRGRSKRARQ